MTIEKIHAYLVFPEKGSEDPPLDSKGTELSLKDKLFGVLEEVYETSERECEIAIAFNASSSGKQENPCRNLIVDYLKDTTIANGAKIAQRLSGVTTNRSGTGLLFLITGKHQQKRKLLVSRFPADNGIIAEPVNDKLNVEFIERVFMRNTGSYKAAVFFDESLEHGFWKGQAIDRQINSQEIQLSQYWISSFLDAGYRTTSATATRRLAIAMREAVQKASDITIKTEITSAANLAMALNGKNLRPSNLLDHFGLSKQAKEIIQNQYKNFATFNEQFRFDIEEFEKHLAFRIVELDNGATLSALFSEFDKVIKSELILPEKGIRMFSTQGRVTNERLRTKK